MPAKRGNPRLIKLHRCYSIEEAARTLGVHKNSIRGWRSEGLEPIDGGRPMLFQGQALRAFLERRNSKRKRPCPPGTLYCFKCREPRPPALAMVDWTPVNDITGNITALCEACETVMHRNARRDALPTILPGISVQIAQGPSRIKGCSSPSLNCDLDKEA